MKDINASRELTGEIVKTSFLSNSGSMVVTPTTSNNSLAAFTPSSTNYGDRCVDFDKVRILSKQLDRFATFQKTPHTFSEIPEIAHFFLATPLNEDQLFDRSIAVLPFQNVVSNDD